jgi:hypothetical protein
MRIFILHFHAVRMVRQAHHEREKIFLTVRPEPVEGYERLSISIHYTLHKLQIIPLNVRIAFFLHAYVELSHFHQVH